MVMIAKKREWRATPSVIDEIFRKSKFYPYLYRRGLIKRMNV